MRDEFSKHRCLGQEWGRLLEAAEKTVSGSFLCLGFVSQSIMRVELFCCFAGQIALWRECVVVFVIIIDMPALFAFSCESSSSNINNNSNNNNNNNFIN